MTSKHHSGWGLRAFRSRATSALGEAKARLIQPRSAAAEDPTGSAVTTAVLAPIPATVPAATPDLPVRMGFGIDVVGFSRRPIPAQIAVQERIGNLITAVLADLGLAMDDVAYQANGDGMNVFLPPDMQLHRALAPLLNGMAARLAADNDGNTDRIQLRMATVVGPVGWVNLGFSGNTIIECGRLLDSRPLREAVTRNQGVDLVVFVSDQLHHYVVRAGYPGLDSSQFQRQQVRNKEFDEPAWLWVGPNRYPPR